MKKNLLSIIFALISTLGFSQAPNYVPANGLVGWWPFNGNANDESGNGNNGTVNGATLTIDRNGVANNAYEFNSSSNNSISIGSFNLLNDFTINAWYKLNSIGGWQNIISKYGANGGYALLFDPNGVLYAHTNQGTASGDACTSNYIENTNIWHMATLILSQGVLKFFIDGIDQGSCTSMNNSSPNSSITYFGRQSAGTSENVNGKLDDIGIWNRALTQQEITNLYTSTVPVSCLPAYVPTSGLVGYWPFCGNANDESGNGNNGTVSGATLTTDRNGVANQAYSFDGSSSIVVSTPSFTFIENQDFSLSCFVYITPQSISGSFVAYGDFQTGNYVWHIGQYNSIMQWGVAIQQYFWSKVDLPSNQVFPNLNSWYHLVGVKINGVISLYVNGVIVGSVNQVIGGALTTNLPLTFGWFTGTGQYMHGSLDDIGIWNRALTECEIQNLYNSTNPTNTTSESACDSYTWNGTTYTTSGVYAGTTSNCVTESLNLSITPSSTNTTTATACDSYTWNGTTYTSSGVYTGNTANCVTESLNLSITPSSTNTTTATACDSYTWNGTNYSASGVYTGATANCITESLNLTITPSSTNTTPISACDSYSWNGQTYTQSGVYTGTTANCVTESLNLTITPSSTNTTTASACNSYTWNGTTYTASGVYNGTTENCVTESLNLTITPSSTNTTTATACNSLTWNGQTYTQSGVYTGTTTNCVTQALNLTINTNTSSSISQTALDSYTWPVNNQTYTTTGAYTAVIPNAAGCDSTITLNLTMSFTGINDLSASKLTIYPNPTNGDFTITGLELLGIVSSLSLTDMNGKVVKVLDTKATKFSMALIKPGVYFLNIRSENKEEVLKIVKE